VNNLKTEMLRARHAFVTGLLSLCLVPPGRAQTSPGTEAQAPPAPTAQGAEAQARPAVSGAVSGTVNDALGRPIAASGVELKGADGSTVATTVTDAQGHFTFTNIPQGTYQVSAAKASFHGATAIVTLSGASIAPLTLTMAGGEVPEIQVQARRLDVARNGILTETGSSVYRITQQDIQNLPQGENTSFNQAVLQAPGVAQDSFGQLHVRGEHANLQYRINGVIIPESITGFGQTLDTRFAQSMNVLTGALPAEYGFRTAGIVDIQTKTGAFANGGSLSYMGGSFRTSEYSGEYAGSQGDLNYYASGTFLENGIGIENPTASRSPIHDDTLQKRGFAYLSYLINASTRLSFMYGTSDNQFQIPNNPDQTPAFTLNGYPAKDSSKLTETQNEDTRYAILALQGTVGDKLDYQVAAFSRYTSVRFNPDYVGDLIFTGDSTKITRSGLNNGTQIDTSYKVTPEHTLRGGLFYSHESFDSFAGVSAFPCCDINGGQTSSTPISFNDNSQSWGTFQGLYAQDEWKVLDQVTINYGARADWVSGYATGSQLSPRLGVVYKPWSETTVHAGYARYFTPPPTELISSKTVADFENTTNAPPSTQDDQPKPERAHYFDAGVSQQVGAHTTVGLDGYYKISRYLIDEGQFGTALLFTPFNYDRSNIRGIEFTAAYKNDPFNAYLNVARSDALGKNIVTAQYNFGPDELAYINHNYIHLDHDQGWTASAGASYLWQRTTFGVDGIFGSGLRSGFANTDHLPAYIQVNANISRGFALPQLGKFEGRFSVINVFDKVYEIRNGTGVGVGAPQFGPRRGFYGQLVKAF
jgi:outer membrane receptor protein involved in Fe transport